MRPIQWCRKEYEMRVRAQEYRVEEQTIKIEPIKTKGFILDIGGGGRGIIGRLHGSRVIAIDKNLRELEETQNDALKLVMDAKDLKFLDNTFNAATSFFTLMYIPNADIPRVFSEAHRVLRPGGRLTIMDAVIPAKVGNKKYFFLPLKIVLPEEVVMARYGVVLKEQTLHTIQVLAHEAGFVTVRETTSDTIFHLELEK